MSNLVQNFDNEFDSFLNLDSNDYTPVSASPVIKPSLSHQGSTSSASTFANSSQPSFSGPTYQYDSHRQQTGLPIGGLANTFAVNQASGLHYRPSSLGFVMPTETLNIPLNTTFDDFDYLNNQPLDVSDMDFDADSPTDMSSMFPSGGESSRSAPVQRMYPGMHSQQAAQAKAAQAQRQEELLRQQQQQKHIPGQQALPTFTKTPAAKDPHVEESISRLLNRMRQSSTASAEGSSPDGSNGAGNLTRTKKEEDEMDEDERLLASEEGKKLSSKERRQLRNKVSARAFRSRRKEYIGQLEGEVAAKAQEANDLRVQNRQLMEENNRLTDLTRMLLSSQAFSGFLQELSNSGASAPNLPTNTATQSARPSSSRKDVSAHEASRQLQNQNQQQVGMTMIPETTIDLSGLELPNNNWSSVPSNDFQVFAVTAIPQPPTLDMAAMTEKRSTESQTPSKDIPVLPTLPASSNAVEEVPQQKVDESVTMDEVKYDLYFDTPATAPASADTTHGLISSLHKPTLTVNTSEASKETHEQESWARFVNMCSDLDESCVRLSRFLP